MSNTQFTDEVIEARKKAEELGFPADEVYEEVRRKYTKENKVNAEYTKYANRVDELGPEK